jgi:UDP-N-acetylglucosamine diphosphorylase/glucosamine-1-phosphate N-acetyltransferase
MLTYHLEARNPRRATVLGKRIYITGNKKNVIVAPHAIVNDLVHIDVTQGPVYIDQGAIVQPFSTIIGPSYIGINTIVDRAKILASSLGPMCRIGGEVEACIFQGYANKHHEGFLGHSFIGEWVNLGALTTNSDLKNNYRPVRIQRAQHTYDTGMLKLGCFIADHTKLGIGTLIPTGAVIGSFVNFFNGGTMPLYVPSFTWLSATQIRDYDLEKAIETARVVMKRRDITMSPHYEKLIRLNHTWKNMS